MKEIPQNNFLTIAKGQVFSLDLFLPARVSKLTAHSMAFLIFYSFIVYLVNVCVGVCIVIDITKLLLDVSFFSP